MTTVADEEPPVYVVRLAELAASQVEDEWQRQADMGGVAIADAWRTGFRAALASLATLPGRCPPASENGVYQTTHSGETLRQFDLPPPPGWPRMAFAVHGSRADRHRPAHRAGASGAARRTAAAFCMA